MMKSWNVWLSSPRSADAAGHAADARGLVSSVHAFAQSSIGTWFVVFMGLCWRLHVHLYLQRSHLKSEHHLESLVSRESSFLFNNLVLLTACSDSVGNAVPDPSEYVVGNKVTSRSVYNRVAVPIGIFLLFLTGVGPLLPWRATSFRSIRRNLCCRRSHCGRR